MIRINNKPFDPNSLMGEYTQKSIERELLRKMNESPETFQYNSVEQLKFELMLRKEIINAAVGLSRSGMDFAVFHKSRCHEKYWERTRNGGFVLKKGVKPSDAINDIYKNGDEYATECATAMVIVYLKALLAIFKDDKFNKMFPEITLMNWHALPNPITEVGLMEEAKTFLPGDRLYFDNPDVDPKYPEWQGENVIFLEPDQYYGHGIGIQKGDTFIRALNHKRVKDSKKSARLLNEAGRPDFKSLADAYYGIPL